MSRPQQEDYRVAAGRRHKAALMGDRFKLHPGPNEIRILPRKNKDGTFRGLPWFEFLQHLNVGPNERWLTCGKNIKGEGKCWLCDVQVPKLAASEKPQLRARASRIEAAEFFALQVAWMDDDQKLKGPVPWSLAAGGSKALSTSILGVFKSTKRDWVSLVKGYNLNIERTGTTFTDTHYGAVIPNTDPSPVPQEIIKRMKTFAELIPPYNEQEMQAAYFGREVEEQEEPEGTYESVDGTGEGEGTEDLGEPGLEGEGPIEEGTGEGTEGLGDDGEPDWGDEEGGQGQDGEQLGEDADAVSKEFEDVFNEPPARTPARRPAAPPPGKKAATTSPAKKAVAKKR